MENYKDKSLQTLKTYFGHSSFRSVQEKLVNSILSGRDVLGIMPTGAGKSVCFQLPAVLFDGITIVISPLISLMKDQISALSQNGIKSAYINSSLSYTQIKKIIFQAQNKEYKLIYIAPERLDSQMFLDFAKAVKISMITIDEAHCVSQWGQDFRASYAKISDFVALINPRPIVSAFTATATPRVRIDIIKMLQLQNPETALASFDRRNLNFEARHPKNKFEELIQILKGRTAQYGIIYCLTRKLVDAITQKLKDNGYNAAAYHAGLSVEERHKNQDDFIFDRVNIIVATNAFGMGIDKSNVSFVLHYNMPKDIESYYQEAGRAGRDGNEADAIILYSGQDIRTNLFLINNSDDKEYASPEEEIYLKSLERKRLKEMDMYCNTHDCLRFYILRYFGEEIQNASNGCGKCGNCNAKSEMEDITVLAQKILSCVYRMKSSFGKNLVIDVLRGSKSARIQQLYLDKISTYNICKESKGEIQEAINYLTMNDFLELTNTEYPVLKLGSRADEILKQNLKVQMRRIAQRKQEIEESKMPKQEIKRIKADIDLHLFARLKELRHDFAIQQAVPAYIVFHDSALIDMCANLPQNEDEFAEISGVGAQKLKKYGEAFIKTIQEHVNAKR
ncbi:MAG: DNA helicase RecQ [Elusimicrobiota bacterium]|jgi:ATP-dependent DNA helicase RecQ|nr:DNA helicase RecQ [Elusimicrobiota bacterium]